MNYYKRGRGRGEEVESGVSKAQTLMEISLALTIRIFQEILFWAEKELLGS